MSKAVANFRQLDVSRAIKAARVGGLDIESVVIDAAQNRITLNVKDGNALPIEPRRKRDDDGVPPNRPENADAS